MQDQLDRVSRQVAIALDSKDVSDSSRRQFVGRVGKVLAAVLGAGVVGVAARDEAAAVCSGRCTECNPYFNCKNRKLLRCTRFCCTGGGGGCQGPVCWNTGKSCGEG